MQHLVATICEVLSAEVAAHEEIYLLSQSKKEAIIQNDIPTLDTIVKQEQIHLARMQDCERKRRAAVLSMAARLSRPAETISLTDFAEAATPTQAQELTAVHEKLTGLLHKQKELNELNRRLIESRLEFIGYALSNIAQQDDPSQIYGQNRPHGVTGKTTKINMIDRKV